jgi:eukaryotic-like serine/threonine-protein kinase
MGDPPPKPVDEGHRTPAVTVIGESAEQVGAVIGSYKLMELIGEGGFGLVFVAEQQKPVRRRVALKVIKPGMDSQEVIRRFEAERQALALMDHLNIARVLDAGATDSGRPYFVMELVHGIPITEYCDRNRLTPRERLQLFVSVCRAVQHAHQKGIIHRDIKPSNVLVTLQDCSPVVKVIDFGVAKALHQPLTDRTIYTRFAQIVGTPLYMSPEQAEMSGLDIDTRSDIYSLGVLLYELLTGTTPFDKKRLSQAAYNELIRIIRDEEPPKPSTRLSRSTESLSAVAAQRKTEPARLSRIVRGDLDWITMKALEKDRTRRYETANGLARDIERYLNDEPVEAGPPGAGYRLWKFARKNRMALRIAGAFVLLLVLGAAGSAWQAIRATVAEHNANTQRDIAEKNEREASHAREQTQRERDHVAVVNQKLERTLGDLRHTLYVSDLNRAFAFWRDGNVNRVEEILDRHRPRAGQEDIRGGEWHYLRRLCDRFQKGRLFDARSDFTALAISPDGKRLATAGRDGALGLWEASTGALQFSVPQVWASGLAFTADGESLITATRLRGKNTARSAPLIARFWDVSMGTEMPASKLDRVGNDRWPNVFLVGPIVFSKDGSALACITADSKLRIGNTANGREQSTLDAFGTDSSIPRTAGERGNLEWAKGMPNFMVHHVALGDDGKTVAWQIGPTTMVWDLSTKTIKFKHVDARRWSFALALSPDCRLLACQRGSEPEVVELWDWKADKKLAELEGYQSRVDVLHFSRDGNLLATGDRFGIVRVWDVATCKEVSTFKGHATLMRDVLFAPDGQWLYSASSDGLVRRWKIVPEPDPDTIDGDSAFYPTTLGLAADGKNLFVESTLKTGAPARIEVRHWDSASRREVSRFQLTLSSIDTATAASPDGRFVLVGNPGDQVVTLWDVVKNREVGKLEIESWGDGKAHFSADSRTVVLINPRRLALWNTETAQRRSTIDQSDVQVIAFSPDGRLLAAATASKNGGAVVLWNASTFAELARFPRGAVQLTFSPDGRSLAAVEGQQVTIWNVETRREQSKIKLTHSVADYAAAVWGAAFSPDSAFYAAQDRFQLQIWDAATGEPVWNPKGLMGLIGNFAWSPDGRTLVTTSGPTLTLWNVATREELTTFVVPEMIHCAVFRPDGSLATADGMNQVRFWRMEPDSGGR